ncbi:MAG: matrixin family metalloprotease [Archangium sp.]
MAAAIAFTAVSAWAQGPEYLNFKMVANQAQPFTYYVDSRPSPVDQTMMRNAVERAWDTWNGVNCASVKTRSLGLATPVPMPLSSADQFSVSALWMVTFDNDAREVFGDTNFVVSISIPRSYAGVLETCDTYFNAFSGSWSLDAVTPTNLMDVETVMLHESGHCQGLDHFGGTEAVMNQVVEAGMALRVLSPTDVAHLCDRYPNEGVEAAACRADGGCDGALKCLQQPVTNGVSGSLCTKGCALNTNALCEIPLYCQPSTAFAGFNGACLMPGTIVTQVGKACTMSPECGSAFSQCRTPEMASNGHFFWVDGYCSQRCEAGDPSCPSGSVCVQLDTGHYCAATCRVGLADCRPEYACAPIDTIQTSGVCIPKCYSDQDCADTLTTTCRTCDGLCVNRQNISGLIGDVCTDSSTCGAGQSCRITASYSGQKQCTQQCARGCGMCPNGNTCTPGANGELFCLKDCTGPGTCPIGLRCADTSVGKGCLPVCNADPDCPVGQSCYMGECYTPQEDGSCALCNRPDAGKPVIVIPKDGGNGTGGDGGCGCVTVQPVWLVLGLLALVRRKKRELRQ